jgi:hypothetical protein
MTLVVLRACWAALDENLVHGAIEVAASHGADGHLLLAHRHRGGSGEQAS